MNFWDELEKRNLSLSELGVTVPVLRVDPKWPSKTRVWF